MRWPESAAAAGLPAAGVAARDVLSPAHAAPAGTGRSNGNVVLAASLWAPPRGEFLSMPPQH
jgi:hypothetical protein